MSDAPKTSMQERARDAAYSGISEEGISCAAHVAHVLAPYFEAFAAAELDAATKDLQWQLDEVLRQRDADIAFDVEAAEQRARVAGMRDVMRIVNTHCSVRTARSIRKVVVALLPEVNREP